MPEKGVTHVSGTGVTYVPSLYTVEGGGISEANFRLRTLAKEGHRHQDCFVPFAESILSEAEGLWASTHSLLAMTLHFMRLY